MSTEVDTRPLGPGNLADLNGLFDSARTTRHCRCMAFCVPRAQFAVGWVTGANQRRFETMATHEATPMGVVASLAGELVGWGACGPRSRYVAATTGRSVMRARSPIEDETVWLLPCLFVRDGRRGLGVTHALVRAAVELARDHGASAIEGWPLAAAAGPSGDAFLGREQVFAAAGFRCIDRPRPERAVMRLDLTAP